MKLTNAQDMKSKSGMTLLELTVVILVLLSLISILFIGARAWKKGSDRAANILNIRNVQQAVRGHANIRGLAEGAALPATDILGAGKYLNTPVAPNTFITYTTPAEFVPIVGVLYLATAYTGTGTLDYAPASTLTAEW